MAAWIKAMDVAELPAPGMRRVELEGVAVLLVNAGDDRIRAFGADCPHAGAPLEKGALCEGRIVCPWHKGAFSIDSGAWLEPPPLEGLTSYPVRVDTDAIFVELEPQRTVRAPTTHAGPASRFAVIGGGAAGAAALATLLESDLACEVTLFAAEPQAPYDRTCLSKFVPAGEMPPDEVPPVLPESVMHDPRLRIDHTEVRHFDVQTKKVTLADGYETAFDAVLLATGSVAKRPDIPGADLGNIYTLRNLKDAGAILDALAPNDHAAILGDSFIALETASALRKRGVEVTLVAPGGPPLQRVLGERVGAMFRDWHEANGVVFRHAKALRFKGAQAVEAVELDDGSSLPAKAVIVGIGVRPATEFVSGLDIGEDGGLDVDATMRVGSGEIYAAGDIARFPLGGAMPSAQRTRIEHWRVAQQHGRIAALNMMGRNVRYEGVPFFWTQHYDKRVEYLGHAGQWDDLVISGRAGDERFGVLYVGAGRVLAVLACGFEREMAILSERMRETLSADAVRGILGF
ncbi:FAD-dependent oxidoreductase [Paraburkholderia sp. J76]|uniref:FAD-dependent oxidoreductase n=1 Tax=Paraburkholderia sp. J76 TaxID=2805439 RepID=UPI002ABE45D2|nr:FAD-dependent oxidoreductase [Paraburkholderia sp. J76]